MGCVSSVSTKEERFDPVLTAVDESQLQAVDRKVSLAMREKRKAGERRIDVFSESVAFNKEIEIPNVPKSEDSKTIIMQSLSYNFLFSAISSDDISAMVNAMSLKSVRKGEVVIKEGDFGDYFYVVESGSYEITVSGNHAGNVVKGGSFGELALLYNCPRAACITCSLSGTLWALDRQTFRHIVARNVADQIDTCKGILKSVSLLESLTEQQLDKLAQAVQLVNFQSGAKIITKGEEGNVLYIVKKGEVVCTDTGDSNNLEDLNLTEGDYFGERALMTNEPRAANVLAKTDVTALALDRTAFDEILGPLRDVIDRNMGIRVLKSVPIFKTMSEYEFERLSSAFKILKFEKGDYVIKQGEKGTSFYIVKSGHFSVQKADKGMEKSELAVLSVGEYFGEMALLKEEPRQADVLAQDTAECFVLNQEEFEELLGPLQDIMNREVEDRKLQMEQQTKMNFSDLDILSTIGTGTFGVVKLARNKHTNQSYALKILQKAQIIAYKQRDNVVNEKNILAMCHHPFILKLHQTFKDTQNLYLLLEFVQGGELFNYLHNSNRKPVYLPNDQTLFYASHVIMALEYLHDRKIVYRDLKPENLLIDPEGYIKVVDFGFAKIVNSRTYTLCGTPEYLAPELVLGKGHNKGVDYWAFGILIFEMLTGHSPFAANNPSDQMQICRNIINGKAEYPKWLSKKAVDLLSKLLVSDPSKRLGCLNRGSRGLKQHPWFESIDWKLMQRKEIKAPWLPTIKNSLDTSNFDPFEEEPTGISKKDIKAAETWDPNF